MKPFMPAYLTIRALKIYKIYEFPRLRTLTAVNFMVFAEGFLSLSDAEPVLLRSLSILMEPAG